MENNITEKKQTKKEHSDERERLRKEREAKIQRRNEILDKKAEKARQIDTRVIETKSEDVGTLVNLLSQTDIALIRLRKHIGGRVNIDDAMAVIRRFEDAVLIIQEITVEAMRLTDSRYLQPKGILAMEERRKNTKDGE